MRASIFATGALASIALVVACTSDRDAFSEEANVLDNDGGSEVSAPGCGFRCSTDLKKVIKTCGSTDEVTECPADQGCGVDSCVSACESARLSKGSVGCSF